MNQNTTPAALNARAINWFEIPVDDLDRAQRCYEAVLGRTLRRESMGPQTELAVFPYEAGLATGGCLMKSPGLRPHGDGPRLYLNAEPSLDAAVGRAERAGLRIVVPRVNLPGEMGAFAVIVDSEGNQVGLHAMA
ncbi:VOC family protein [Leptothrix discophora]|uniref:VOC family protein n=1 Tax=Leptothrix discophora TaxID=89 RepID=A0ABT9FZR8_LEPDI|nr:VOC family protein [Leptothrix discophora]MDP4299720.1 VOC family protein [Leptothrix discophora]